MSPLLPAEPAPALSRRAWLALGLVGALGFAHFWLRTTPVRLANADDVTFQALVDRDEVAGFTSRSALEQGRFYFETPVFGPLFAAPYQVGAPRLFGLLRTVVFFTQIGLAGWLLGRVVRSPAWGAALALFVIGTLHLPLTFYPILSYTNLWIGFIAVLGALHCHLSYVRRPGLGGGIMTGALLLLAGLMHEIFMLFMPLFIGLSCLKTGGWMARARASVAPLATAAGYAGAYVFFAREFPSRYGGTEFSLNLAGAGRVIFRQMAGIVPGFELWVRRLDAGATGPLFRPLSEIGQTLAATPWADILLGVLEGVALTLLLVQCARQIPAMARHWPWAVGFAAFLNLPIAFSQKYQVFILHREFPYVYAFYASIFLSVAFVGGLAWAWNRPGTRLDPRLATCLLGLGLTALCVSAMASNHRVLGLLLAKYN